jgi:hypothetical protein
LYYSEYQVQYGTVQYQVLGHGKMLLTNYFPQSVRMFTVCLLICHLFITSLRVQYVDYSYSTVPCTVPGTVYGYQVCTYE